MRYEATATMTLTPEGAALGKRRLPLLTNSSMNMFRRCPREYFYAYVLRRRSKTKAEALRFGSFFHIGLNAWWRAPSEPEERYMHAVAAMHEKSIEPGEGDLFELAKAEELILGYTARWGYESYKTIGVEVQFRLPLSDDFDLGGSIDAVVSSASGVHNVEHKTTSKDISPGSIYWRNLVALDPQVSTYMRAAHAMGHHPMDTVYDVIRKPSIEPLKATPEEDKRYTKPTKSEPIPRLYAKLREADETVEEYRIRLRTDISSNPDRYYQRQSIVRLEADIAAHDADILHTAEMVQFSIERDAWPRTPGACIRYGRLCCYHDVCSGSASIDDSMFETKESTHEELGDV